MEATKRSLVRFPDRANSTLQPGNTKGRSITVPLASCLTALDLSILQIKTKIVSCYTAASKPVKQEVNGTVILPPLVFRASANRTKPGQVFNSRSGRVYATHSCCYWVKLPNLKLKTQPKQLLGSLPLDILLPAWTVSLSCLNKPLHLWLKTYH
jgi:hypothetical protein